MFWKYHNEGVLKKYKPKLQVGSLDTKPKPAEATPASKPAPKPEPKKTESKKAEPAKASASAPAPEALEPYGALIPFADPSWYQGVSCDGPQSTPLAAPAPSERDCHTDTFRRSTIRPTSTRPTPPSAPRCASGSTTRSNLMSPSGTRRRRCPPLSTRRWAAAATSPVCWV